MPENPLAKEIELFAKIAKASDIDTLEALPVPIVANHPGGTLQDPGRNDHGIRRSQTISGPQNSGFQEDLSTNCDQEFRR